MSRRERLDDNLGSPGVDSSPPQTQELQDTHRGAHDLIKESPRTSTPEGDKMTGCMKISHMFSCIAIICLTIVTCVQIIPGGILVHEKQMKNVNGILKIKINLRASPDLAKFLCTVDDLMKDVILKNVAGKIKQEVLSTVDQILFTGDLLKSSTWMSHLKVNCSNVRNKRGLFNLGGDALRLLFNTATLDDVSLVESQLDFLKHSLKDTFTNIEKSVSTLYTILKNTTSKIESRIIENELRGILNSLHIILNHIHICDTIMSLSNNNIIHKSLIREETFFKAITEAVFALKLEPILPLSTEFFREYVNLCNIKMDDAPYITTIEVPLSNKVDYMSTLLVPFPTVKRDSPTGEFLIISQLDVFMFYNELHYFEVSYVEYENFCSSSKTLHLCKFRTKRGIDNDDCLGTIAKYKDSRNCLFENVMIHKTPTLKRLDTMIFINCYYCTDIKIICSNSSVIDNLGESKIIIIKKECKLNSNIIAVDKLVQESKIVKLYLNIPENHFFLPLEEYNFQDIQFPMLDANYELSKNENISKQIQFNFVFNYCLLGFLILLIAGVIVFILCKKIQSKRRSLFRARPPLRNQQIQLSRLRVDTDPLQE